MFLSLSAWVSVLLLVLLVARVRGEARVIGARVIDTIVVESLEGGGSEMR